MGLGHHRLAGTRRLCTGVLVDRRRALSDRRRQIARRIRRAARCGTKLLYGVNFELGFNAGYWDPSRTSSEIRPIIGGRLGPVDLIVNPILDTSFQGLGSLTFAPASRVAYNFSETWAAALEHYADYGRLNNFGPLGRQQQLLFAVVDYKSALLSVEFGIGHGFTVASDPLVLKLILSRDF